MMKLRDLISHTIASLEAEGKKLRAEAENYLSAHEAKLAKWRALTGHLEHHLDSPAKIADTPEAVAKQFGK